MKNQSSTFLIVAILIQASGAEAAAIGASFDELQVGEDVLEYYNGGFGNLGTGPGPQLGISFGPGWIAGPPDNYGEPGGKSGGISRVAIVNVHQGFAGLTGFYYIGAPLVVDFYDQENGLGTLVWEFDLPAAGGGLHFGGLADGTVPFFKSEVFRSSGNRIDSLAFGAAPLPEPGTLEFSLLGVAVLSLAGLGRSWRRVRRWMIRRGPSLLCSSLVLSVSSSVANAAGIPITGTAGLRQAPLFGDIETFSFSGPGINIFSTPFSVVPYIIRSCKVSEICNLDFTLEGTHSLVPGYGGGTVDGKTANAVVGTMSFSGAAFVPVPIAQFFTAPVTLMGGVRGLQLTGGPQYTATDVFDVFVTGTGTITLQIQAVSGCPMPFTDPSCVAEYHSASWSYTGTAVVIPEPATILLLATGLACFAARVRVPRRSGMQRAKPVPSLRAGLALLVGPDKKGIASPAETVGECMASIGFRGFAPPAACE